MRLSLPPGCRLHAAFLTMLLALPATGAGAAADPALAAALRVRLAGIHSLPSASLRDQRREAALQAVYAQRADAPLWSVPAGPSRQATALLRTLAAAEDFGLRAEDYRGALSAGPAGAEGWGAGADADRRARFDLELSTAALHFVTDLHQGRVEPAAAGFQLGVDRAALDLVGMLERLATTDHVDQLIATIEPPFYHYSLLKQTLARYRLLAAQPELSRLPRLPTRSVKPGEHYEGAPELRRLLVALGDLPAIGVTVDDERRLDATLVASLQRFQERHSLPADGALGKTTYAAVTTPLAKRVRQIELTLERWRWLPPFDAPPIIVNIPQYRLFAFRSAQDRTAGILQMDVIVGKAYHETRTPVFVGDMQFVIFRPYWDVPRSIALREELPRIRMNPDYLEAEHLEIVRSQSDSASPLPATTETLEGLARGDLRLRQRPGPGNALGLIKFMLPNPYNVYLHSTPVHRLFSESRRAFSHGCIRVSDPVALAEYVLRDTPGGWTKAAIEAAMDRGPDSQRVNLAQSIHVMILYATALATEAGPVLFFEDIYGYDHKLEALLGLRAVGET
jgi:murein L,D-transpeptidase YcbB/YkuD